ncbi:MAG: universal stress protein [Sphaerochaetaceae bacterium]|nr:universal stress protein [Sphaerochaetaceae bacterium]
MLFRNILVYIDSSESAMIAAMHAILIAKETDAKLTALYVVDTKSVGDLLKARIFVDAEKDLYEEDLKGDAQRYLRQVSRLAERKGFEIETETLSGSVSHEVRDYIKSHDVDLLVLGGIRDIRSRRDEMLSESDRLLRTASCPVLLVRDDSDIWESFEEE